MTLILALLQAKSHLLSMSDMTCSIITPVVHHVHHVTASICSFFLIYALVLFSVTLFLNSAETELLFFFLIDVNLLSITLMASCTDRMSQVLQQSFKRLLHWSSYTICLL